MHQNANLFLKMQWLHIFLHINISPPIILVPIIGLLLIFIMIHYAAKCKIDCLINLSKLNFRKHGWLPWWYRKPVRCGAHAKYEHIGNLINLHTEASSSNVHVDTLRLRQNGRHFPDDTFKLIFLNENVRVSITISLKFVPKGPSNNFLALVQIMAWCRPGNKPLSEPMIVSLLMHICISRPQWVTESFTIHDLCNK